MIFGIMTLLTALMLSAVAAYYSITGLTAIFPGVVIPIIIMGCTLEISKIVATVWLHKYWNRAALQFKLYLIPAIIVLMIITSTGIFGYLSAAHLSQSTANEDISSQVSLLDEKIKTEQDNISVNKRALQQMDAQVDQMLGRTTDDKGANRAVQIRKQQAKERKSLQADISIAQKNISTLQAERAPIAAKSRVAESHIGPIRYIAALIYGDNPNADLLERAVRWVIILLVFVFDPLALILILAAEQTIAWARKVKDERKGWHQEWVPDTEAWPEWDDEITEEQIGAIKAAAGNVEMTSMSSTLFDTEREFFDHGKEVAREIDANDGILPKHHHTALLNDVEVTVPEETSILDQHPYLKKPWSWMPKQEVKEEPAIVTPIHHDPDPIRGIPPPADDPEPINVGYKPVNIPDLSINAEPAKETKAGFGTEFPANPDRGDLFLRVDYLPGKTFKWNGVKWIEVDKEKIDQFAYDLEYIKHLVEKIDSGEYDVELLTATEQEQIQRYLNGTNQQ